MDNNATYFSCTNCTLPGGNLYLDVVSPGATNSLTLLLTNGVPVP